MAPLLLPHRLIHRRSKEPTSGLEPLSCSLRVSQRALQGVQEVSKPAFLDRFPFFGLHGVEPYRAPGGISVVSIQPHITFDQRLTRDDFEAFSDLQPTTSA